MLLTPAEPTSHPSPSWFNRLFSGSDQTGSDYSPDEDPDFSLPHKWAVKLRILIVEDNHDAARTLQELLQFEGHEVEVAHNGLEGVVAARSFLPQVVLCDIGLPGLDGWQVASTLRAEPATAHSRFIAVSGYGSQEDRRRSEQAGFEAHITKPLDLDHLMRLLRKRS